MGNLKARVYVKLKDTVLDPEGKTIKESLQRKGYEDIESVKVGKYFDIELEVDSRAAGEALLSEISERILSNPIIEENCIEVVEEG